MRSSVGQTSDFKFNLLMKIKFNAWSQFGKVSEILEIMK